MRVAQKINLSLLLLTSFIVGTFMFSYIVIVKLQDHLYTIYESRVKVMESLSVVQTDFSKVNSINLELPLLLMAGEDSKKIEEQTINAESLIRKISKDLDNIKSFLSDSSKVESGSIDKLIDLVSKFSEITRNIKDLSLSGDAYSIVGVNPDRDKINKRFETEIKRSIEFLIVSTHNDYESSISTITISKYIFFTILIFTAIVLFYTRIVLSKSITKPLNQIRVMLKEIAEGDGDLSRRLEISSNDEIGELAEYFNVFVEKLQDVIRLTNDHIYDISIGNIPEPIVQEFHGDFETIKESINELIKVNTKMLDEISNVVSSAEKSDFSIRANSLGCLGDWQKVLIGVNELVGISEGFVEKVKNNIIDLERESTKIRKVLEYQNLESSKISNILQEIANGDLSVEYRPENENLDNSEIYDIFLQISNSLGNTIFSLSSVLNETRIVSSDIEENAFLLSNVSKNMSTGASEQAKSLDELTVAVSEISTQTKLNAENAQMASKLAFEAKEASEIGNKEMTDLAKAMFEISSSANGIMKVIKVIDDIAFQTNLLALNAAVEAARAGVHGRGFAVVADEVRNLAQKSAEAARETADLIQASTAKSEKGNSLSNRTAKSLKEIEDKISKAVELIEEIAISSEEQAKGIEYSNKALIQIGKIAKENTETSIETENSTNKLLDHIEDLKKSLNMFKIR